MEGGKLASLLAKSMGEIKPIGKSGRNTFHGYNYATEADAAEAVRGVLAANGVAFLPSVKSYKLTPSKTAKGGDQMFAEVVLTVRFKHGGEVEESEWIGTATDSPGDKSVYKAITGAEKYALFKTFLIPTGDDPERDAPEEAFEKAKRQSPKQQAAAAGAVVAQQVQDTREAKQMQEMNAKAATAFQQPKDYTIKVDTAGLKRFHAVRGECGLDDVAGKKILAEYGLTSSKDIPAAKLEAICRRMKQFAGLEPPDAV